MTTDATHLDLIDTNGIAYYDQAPYRAKIARVASDVRIHTVTDSGPNRLKVTPTGGSPRWVPRHTVTIGA